jgi:hypothetical protein
MEEMRSGRESFNSLSLFILSRVSLAHTHTILTAVEVRSVVVSPHEGRVNFPQLLRQTEIPQWMRLQQVLRVEDVILISCTDESRHTHTMTINFN